MDSEKGKELYKFDRSMMERLADLQMPMTQINVQRRMRPTISHFIRYVFSPVTCCNPDAKTTMSRTILYPKLEDNELVHRYPAVRGMQKDVYFLNHTHAEAGTEDSVSKFNEYEVRTRYTSRAPADISLGRNDPRPCRLLPPPGCLRWRR